MSDVDTSGEKRRRNKRWPEALKREIVAATCLPGASVSVVARQYDVNANQVFAGAAAFGERSTDAIVVIASSVGAGDDHARARGRDAPAPAALPTRSRSRWAATAVCASARASTVAR